MSTTSSAELLIFFCDDCLNTVGFRGMSGPLNLLINATLRAAASGDIKRHLHIKQFRMFQMTFRQLLGFAWWADEELCLFYSSRLSSFGRGKVNLWIFRYCATPAMQWQLQWLSRNTRSWEVFRACRRINESQECRELRWSMTSASAPAWRLILCESVFKLSWQAPLQDPPLLLAVDHVIDCTRATIRLAPTRGFERNGHFVRTKSMAAHMNQYVLPYTGWRGFQRHFKRSHYMQSGRLFQPPMYIEKIPNTTPSKR